MNEITVTAKTIEEAIQKALEDLHTTRDNVKIEILEDPANALSDLKPIDAVVRVSRFDDTIQRVKDFLEKIIELMGLSGTVEIVEAPERIIAQIDSSDSALLIGRNGQNLDALQHLVNRMVSRGTQDAPLVILDIENYRASRFENLERMTKRAVGKVRETGKEQLLPKMGPLERRFIHKLVSSQFDVVTFSKGTEGRRGVVIAPAEKDEEQSAGS